MPANILNLSCYKLVGIQENEHDYHIDVETLHAPTSCPHCQSINLVGFGRREQMVKDLPMHGRRVGRQEESAEDPGAETASRSDA